MISCAQRFLRAFGISDVSHRSDAPCPAALYTQAFETNLPVNGHPVHIPIRPDDAHFQVVKHPAGGT